ncbi:hypothetical protein [Streptomyces aureus]
MPRAPCPTSRARCPLPVAFAVAGITVLVIGATAATGQAWRRRLRNA